MLKTRSRRLAFHSAGAAQRLADIEKAIVALDDEDLLDLADIFRSNATAPLAKMAATEMTKRGISL